MLNVNIRYTSISFEILNFIGLLFVFPVAFYYFPKVWRWGREDVVGKERRVWGLFFFFKFYVGFSNKN